MSPARSRPSSNCGDFAGAPRPITDHFFDLACGVFAGLIGALMIAGATSVQPALLTFPASCVALVAVGAVALKRIQRPRLRASALGAVTSGGLLLAIGVVVVVAEIVVS